MTLVGKGVPRTEDDKLLKGRGVFSDDLHLPRMVHLAFVRSPHAHARIRAVRTARAAALPGVLAVFTGADIAKLCKPIYVDVIFPDYKAPSRPVVAVDVVKFVGDAVAVVVAESRYLGEDAVDLVEVDYEPLPAIVDLEAALAPTAPVVHPELGDNVLFKGTFATEGFDRAFASGDVVLRERFQSTRVAGVPLEARGCVAAPEPGRGTLTLWSSTQIPHMLRTALADLVVAPGLTEAKIRVITPEVGGGFGTKAHVYPEELVTAALAMKLNRPVKWTQDRREELLTDIHARDHVYEVDVAVTREGVLRAVRTRILTNAGAFPSLPFGCTLEPTGGARMLPGPYRLRDYAYECYAITTNTGPSGAYRGVAQPTCFMAIEGMMDRIGRALGIDPAEVRFRNLIQPDEMPYVNVVGVRYDTGSYVAALRKALDLVGYDELRARQRAGRLRDGKYHGIGIACFTEVSGTGAPGFRARGLKRIPGFDSALLKVEPTGAVTCMLSTAGAGQGHETTFAQLIADELGVPFDAITVIEGDTNAGPYGSGTFASRSVVTGGGAIVRAGAKLRGKMARLAAHLLEAAPEDIVFADGHASVRGMPATRVSVREIAENAYSMSSKGLPPGDEYGLEATDYYDPPLVTMANATHVVAVAVDARRGSVEIERYVVVHDCGRIINPTIVDGQVHGGAAQGIGQAMLEAMVYGADGQCHSATFMDYLLPTAADVPPITVAHIESPSIDAAGGFKGVGEGGVIGAVPALTNAVADALADLGINVNRTPLTPDRVLALIESATTAAGPRLRKDGSP
jgi:carbon-monoxide dehydrogenase large subunit